MYVPKILETTKKFGFDDVTSLGTSKKVSSCFHPPFAAWTDNRTIENRGKSATRSCVVELLRQSHFLVFPVKLTIHTMIRSSLNASKLAQRGLSRYNGAVRTMGGKEILFGVEGRAAMLRGVDMLADAVQVRRFANIRKPRP